MKYFFPIITLFALTLTSCNKEIEFKGDIGERQLVVNCIMENDSVIQVALSKSTPAIGEQNYGSNIITSSATLVLLDETTGEIFTSSAVNAENVYEFGTTAKEGHSYSISVSHSEFKTASASSMIPTAVAISDWDTSSYKMDGQTFKTLDITLNDPSQDNYYIVTVSIIDTVFHNEYITYLTVNQSAGYDLEEGTSIFIKDDLFQNSTKKLSVEFTPKYYYDQSYLQIGEQSYKINLYSVSKEAYLYLLSVTKSMNTEESPFSEPVRVFSNITNGLGVFGGLAKNELIIE